MKELVCEIVKNILLKKKNVNLQYSKLINSLIFMKKY